MKRSKYSTMLQGLKSEESRADSQLWMEVCDRIDREFEKRKKGLR